MTEIILPKLKPVIQFNRINDKVYFKKAGGALEMDDATGFMSALCERLLEGRKTMAELGNELAGRYPEEVQYLHQAITTLDEAYLLEDGASQITADLTPYDLERWSRNTEFFGAYCRAKMNKYAGQLRLKTIRVGLLGLGGLGSHLLYDLVALGVQDIRAVDFDRIELSNLNRQVLYNEEDIGQLKTEMAAKRIQGFNQQAKVEFVNKKIASSQDIEALVHDREIVICVADKPKKDMLNWLNTACVKHGVTFMNGGVDINRAVLSTVIPGHTGCVECWKHSVEANNPLANTLLQRETPADSPIAPDPAVVTFVSLLTGLLLTEFLKLSSKIAEPRSPGKLLSFDFDSFQLQEAESWQRNPGCPVCASTGVNG